MTSNEVEFGSLMMGAKPLNLTVIRAMVDKLSPEQLVLLAKRLKIKDPKDLYNLIEEPAHPTHGYEESLMFYQESRIRKALLLYIPPVIILLGTFGNIFSFIILRRKTMIKFSTYFYLAILAITDTLVLYIGLLRLWVGELQGADMINRLDWLCKFANAIGSTVSDMSVWLIIAVTVERYIVVCYPLNASSMCNTPRARMVTLGLLALFLMINAHFFWTVELISITVNGENITKCRGGPSFEKLVDDIWPSVDIVIYSCLPFVVILGLNTLIIRQVVMARRVRTGLQSTSVYEQRRPSSEGSTKLTAMLLTISFAFLITTLPLTVCNITAAIWNQSSKPGMEKVAKFNLTRTVAELLMYVNHSMNFFLYCATGQKFRHQLVWMLCYARRNSAGMTWASEHTRLESIKNGKSRTVGGETVEMTDNINKDAYKPLKPRWSDE